MTRGLPYLHMASYICLHAAQPCQYPHQPHCHTTPRVLTPMCCPAGDVYYFCGSRMQYCTCTHRWNLAGWAKAGALWAFVLCTTLGVQRLLIEVVLQGLLPGE
jgi:hypothetical protein